MTSQFFYLPSDKKVEDEVRIKFTQSRMKAVKDWFNRKLVCKFTENNFDPRIFLDNFEKPKNPVSIQILTDKDCNVVKRYSIDANFYNKVTDDFCAEYRCKIDKMDFLYLLMLTFRDNGIEVSPVKGTLNISL